MMRTKGPTPLHAWLLALGLAGWTAFAIMVVLYNQQAKLIPYDDHFGCKHNYIDKQGRDTGKCG